jgi:protein-S-isoprenylcysteine O-methyltransferase Ste14
MGVADVGYGKPETSRTPRRVWIAVHLLQLLAAAAILAAAHGDPARRLLLCAFGVVLWLRMTYTGAVLLERRFSWAEAAAVASGTAVYQLGFAALGAGTTAPIGVLDVVAVVLYLGGGAVNTLSELARKRFKARPENRGRLYTRGLFAVTRHPNYLGDILWGTGWALATRNAWSAILVALEAAGFACFNVPALDRYLASRYGAEYEAWARRTKRLVPFVY